ncbi:MAG: hypothetical protein GQ557_01520 [Mycoplasmataceae bacterium]|nr:hypothetical protein [Mycoplasmataceae bacterium]
MDKVKEIDELKKKLISIMDNSRVLGWKIICDKDYDISDKIYQKDGRMMSNDKNINILPVFNKTDVDLLRKYNNKIIELEQ